MMLSSPEIIRRIEEEWFETEGQFQDFIIRKIKDAGFSLTEISKSRGVLRMDIYSFCFTGNKFFIECKLFLDSQSFASALGQCLVYKELEPDYEAIICCYELRSSRKDWDFYRKISAKHGVTLCSELDLIEHLREKYGTNKSI